MMMALGSWTLCRGRFLSRHPPLPSLCRRCWRRLLARPASGAFWGRFNRLHWEAAARLKKPIEVGEENALPIARNYDVRRSIGRELHGSLPGPQRSPAQDGTFGIG